MYTTYPPEPELRPPAQRLRLRPDAQQPMPMAAPVAPVSSTNTGLLMIAGLAVVGAAAFGGVYLMNTSHSEPTAATTPSTVRQHPLGRSTSRR